MDQVHRHGAFANGGRDALHRGTPDVARRRTRLAGSFRAAAARARVASAAEAPSRDRSGPEIMKPCSSRAIVSSSHCGVGIRADEHEQEVGRHLRCRMPSALVGDRQRLQVLLAVRRDDSAIRASTRIFGVARTWSIR